MQKKIIPITVEFIDYKKKYLGFLKRRKDNVWILCLDVPKDYNFGWEDIMCYFEPPEDYTKKNIHFSCWGLTADNTVGLGSMYAGGYKLFVERGHNLKRERGIIKRRRYEML